MHSPQMAESHIDTRTGEQMLQQAYDRIIAIAEVVTKDYIHEYTQGDRYLFPFDKQQYVFLEARADRHYPGGFLFKFLRISDREPLLMTKYAVPPLKIDPS